MGSSAFVRSIGAQVRAERESQGLTQKCFAQKAGVSERLLRSLEMGDAAGIQLDKLLGILKAAGLTFVLSGESSQDEATVHASSTTSSDEYSALLHEAVAGWMDGASV